MTPPSTKAERWITVKYLDPATMRAIRFWRNEPWPDIVDVFDEPGYDFIVPQGEPFVQEGSNVWRLSDGDWIICDAEGTVIDVRSDHEMFSIYRSEG